MIFGGAGVVLVYILRNLMWHHLNFFPYALNFFLFFGCIYAVNVLKLLVMSGFSVIIREKKADFCGP